jgi:hypothetical protein
MIVFDTEDNSSELLKSGKSGFDKTITQIAAICDNGKRFYNTGNVKQFLKWIHEQGGDVWGFNTQYDIGNLCHAGKLTLDEFDLILVKGRFIKAKLQGINFYDVRNITGAGSVGKLGVSVGLPKFGFPYSEKELKNFSPARVKEWRAFEKSGDEKFSDKRYVFRDCEIPLAWIKFVKEKCEKLGIETIPATLGGLCVKTFHALHNENWFECSPESASALIGARVELFSGGGRGRIAYCDINSLYPWCMTQLFPEYMEKLETLDGYGIAKVNIFIPKMTIAPLPVKDKENRLLFPTGKLSGVWTIHEIKNAVAAGGRVEKIFWIYGSKTGKAYYRDYISAMYQNRQDSKTPAENLFWKLLMNNLYGRLAIGGVISRSLLLTQANKMTGLPYGKKLLADYEMPLPKFTNYLHAAYVLSYARIRLFGFLKTVPPENLIYCDTDSMIFFCQGEIPFQISKELGEMKLESWGKRCKPILPKTYIFDKNYKAKGVPARHAKKFIQTGKANYESPFKIKESIRFYDAENSRKLSVWRKVEKIMQTSYTRKKANGKFFLPKTVKMY